MALLETTVDALNNWVVNEPWHERSSHPMNAFFEFVNLYYKDNGHAGGEERLREVIENSVVVVTPLTPDLANVISERAILAFYIMSFLDQTGR